MAFEKGIATVTLEVQAAPGAFLSATPHSLVVARGDMAVYHLTISPVNGFAGPIFLRSANLAGGHEFSPNPVPAGGGASTLTIDTGGWQPGPPFEIGLEAVDVLPEGELPATLED